MLHLPGARDHHRRPKIVYREECGYETLAGEQESSSKLISVADSLTRREVMDGIGRKVIVGDRKRSREA